MFNTKHLITVILSLALSFSAFACSKDKKETNTAASHTSSTSDDSGKTTDKSSAKKKDAKSSESSGSFNVDSSSNNTAQPQQDFKKLGQQIARTKFDYNAIDASAKDVEAALETAKKGNVSTAITSLKSVTDKNPKAFLGFYNLGVLYERQLFTSKAKEAYENALKAEPRFTQALIQLVRLNVRNGNKSEAISVANRYISANPGVFEHNYAKLEALIANGQYDESIALVRVLLKRDEANAKLRYYLALAEFHKKRYRLAEFMVNESLEIDNDDFEALFLLARIHDVLSEEDVALIPGVASTLDRVLELNPDHVEALWRRGVIYYEASNYTKAEEFFRHVIELNPSIVGAYIDLANTLKTQNKGPEAEQLLNKAKTLDPRNGLVDFAMGTLYLNFELIELPGMDNMARLKKAKTCFETAQANWTSKDDKDLAKGYIRTTDDAIETLEVMLANEAFLRSTSSDDSEGGDDSPKTDDNSGSDDKSGSDTGRQFLVD